MGKTMVIIVSAMNLGGAQRVVSILCDHWSQNGYQVTLISTYTGEKHNHYLVNENVSLRDLSEDTTFIAENQEWEKKGSVYPPVNGKGGNNQVKLMHALTYIDRAKHAKSVN